jgi:hypothetical protein
MTPEAEARLDRLERIAKLFVTAGIRARRNMRELDEKIGIVIDFQIQNEERFKAQEERFKEQDAKINILIEFQQRNEERFAQLAEYQANTDRRVDKLLEIVRNGRDGH